jgi:ABC-type uncharacterized transport system permease subunit
MDMLLSILNWLLPLIYLALAIDYGATFILRNRTHVRNPWVILAIVFHGVFLVLGVCFGGLPLVDNQEILSVVALSSAVVYCAIELVTRDRRAGVFVFLLIFLMQYTSSIFLSGTIAQAGASTRQVQNAEGLVHVLLAALAYTGLAIGAVYAMLYLIGQRNMKHHNFGLLFDRLPPLDLLGRMCFQALLVGFAFITITMITGVLFSQTRPQTGDSMDPKLLAKIIIGSTAWVICAVDVFGKYVLKWSISRVSAIALIGFLIIAALFVTSLALS